MAYMSAREMLARFPVKMARGGGIDYSEGMGDFDIDLSGINAAAIAAAAKVKQDQQTALNQTMTIFNNAGGGQAGTNAVLTALETNGLTLQDLSTQTGVPLTEIDSFLGTQADAAAAQKVIDDAAAAQKVIDDAAAAQKALDDQAAIDAQNAAQKQLALDAGFDDWSAGLNSDAYLANQAAGTSDQYNASLLAAEEAYLADPSKWDAVTTYKAMIEGGISVKDALNAGVEQSTVDQIFTSPQLDTSLITTDNVSILDTNPNYTSQAQITDNAAAYMATIMADGEITAAERNQMLQIATSEGVTLQDLTNSAVDANILFDTTCPDGSMFDQATQQCVNDPADPRPCPIHTAYNAATNTCDPDGTDPRPCPIYTAYNEVTGTCDSDGTDPRPCPDGTAYNAATNICDPDETVCNGKTCGDGYTLNPETCGCVDDSIVCGGKTCSTGFTLNVATCECINDAVCDGKTCGDGYTLDTSTCQCVLDNCPTGQERFDGACVVICPEGSSRNAAGQCISINQGCPTGQERVNGTCVNLCPEGSIRNANGVCETVGIIPDCSLGGTREGWSYNATLSKCVKDDGGVTCTLPYKLNTNTQKCELDVCNELIEELNMLTGNCEGIVCGDGTLLDPTTGKCVLDKSCDTGFSWSETESKCVADREACGTGYTRNLVTGKCDKDEGCGAGKVWDPIALKCVTDTTCPSGFTWQGEVLKCVKNTQNTDCGDGMKWSYSQNQCVSIFNEVDTDTGSGAATTTSAGSATGVAVSPDLVGATGIYGADVDALDEVFRKTPARTEVTQDVMGTDQLVGFNYTPAASLLSATGSGIAGMAGKSGTAGTAGISPGWTPPSVTSRPRSLMDNSVLNRYTRGRAAQDLSQLTGGNQVSFDRYKGLLSNTGSYGGGLSRSQIFGQMRQQDATERRAATEAERVAAVAAEAARVAALTDAERLAETQKAAADKAAADFAKQPLSGFSSGDEWWKRDTGKFYGDYNAGLFYGGGDDGTVPFARGGSVKKPKGFADGGTASADLKALDSSDSLFITEDIVEEVNPDNIQRDILPMEWDGVERPTPMQTESKNMLETLASGFPKAVNTAANYVVRGEPGVDMSLIPMGELASDTKALGGMLYEALKEDPVAFFAENLPVVAQIVAGRDMNEFTGLANEARASGDSGLADMYEQIVVLSAAGIIPGGAAANKAAKTTAVKAARDAAKATASDSARMLDEVDAVNAPRADLDFSATVVSKMQEIALRPSVASDPVAMRFLNQIMDDPDAAIAQYAKIGETNGGKIINTDLVRELSPDYLADRTLAFNVHQPASALSEIMFNRRVAETMGEEGTWIFTGGGPASGKTAGLSKEMERAADLVMDGTLAKFAKNDALIEKALESGKDVQIVYIDRDPLKALPLALMRAMESGRPVPLMEFARMHRDARSSVRQLHEKYKDNPKVDIQIVDNQGKMGEQFDSTIDKISEMDYDKTLTEGFKMLEEARLRPEKKGDVNGGISEAIYQGTKGNYDPPAAQSQTSRVSQDGTQGNQGNRQGVSRQQTGVNALEVGVDESLSGGQRLRNYTPDNLKTLEELATKATAGTQKADALINAPVEAGSKIGIRLNLNSKIPDAPKGLDKLQTLHKNNFNGKALSYVPYATVENVTFNVNQKGRQGIAAKISNIDVPEAKNKYPAMSVDGNYVPDKNVFLSGKDFVEIGFNPKANHLFIDMNTGQAVKGADLATVVGDRVYARGVQYYKKSEAPEVLSASDGTELPSQVRYKMKRGGSVERVYNDRRYI